jgi:hypothetical protein
VQNIENEQWEEDEVNAKLLVRMNRTTDRSSTSRNESMGHWTGCR